ncbi:C4-dicarboxylate ABC transporter permease [Sulfitobacter sp. EhC04]|uniref:TRAP transporter large permease n=1 Tax=Sulfitobacter sp. EhC04 TaxID=1849168 RepID=UPI0007F3384A|nr:TRAP transporter large permease subunit [Sulfitobacter sp. EhC04]OAN73484.1 C4-dicarboxylate ABC transporter permease [Sulfitobacter sp. EhC04]
MEWYYALSFLLGMILFLMFMGIPVALAFIAANMIGATYFMGGSGDLLRQMSRGIGQLVNNALPTVTTFNLMPVPMFLLMGEIFFHTGLGNKMFAAVEKLMGRIPGRLSFVTVAGGTAFATLSGSSLGSTALLGSLMVPEMEAKGYKKHMAIGPILGTGGLAMLIPPSALAVLLATLATLDVGDLLLAGVVPGLMLACFYVILILGLCLWDPTAAPAYEVEQIAFSEKMRLLFFDIMPMMSIVVGVILLIMNGWATPSESAAFGCVGVLLLAIGYRKLTWTSFVASVTGALRVTTMALLIIFGSATFSALLAFSGASSGLIRWATQFDFDPIVMLVIMFCILLVLGMFMDQLSMMLLTVPIFFPLAQTLGFDLIWFGVIILMALEISFTTPPFGLLLFVMKGVAPPDTTMRDIYMAALPYMGCAILLVVLLIIFPQIALWLPNMGE